MAGWGSYLCLQKKASGSYLYLNCNRLKWQAGADTYAYNKKHVLISKQAGKAGYGCCLCLKHNRLEWLALAAAYAYNKKHVVPTYA